MIKHFSNLFFTIKAIPKDYYVDYFVYAIQGITLEGDPLWKEINTENSSNLTDSLEKAEIYLYGTVKYDGCSNWYFAEQDRALLHGCDKQDLENLGKILGICWDWTIHLCPNWSS